MLPGASWSPLPSVPHAWVSRQPGLLGLPHPLQAPGGQQRVTALVPDGELVPGGRREAADGVGVREGGQEVRGLPGRGEE